MDSSFAAPPSPTSSKSADSKRSSATSGVESSSEMNDAETRDANDVEEEEDEKTSNKYEEVDIAVSTFLPITYSARRGVLAFMTSPGIQETRGRGFFVPFGNRTVFLPTIVAFVKRSAMY